MMNFSRRGFKDFYEKYDEKKLKNMVDLVYCALCKQFNNEVSFGIHGCKEFLGAILLFKYDKSLEKAIVIGLCKTFQNKFTPLDFSEYMDEVIHQSSITMDEWIDICDYIERNHRWIEKHKCA